MMKTIFWNVDTQRDFMNKDGALYVPNAEEINPNLKRLTDHARQHTIPVLGSVDRHFGTPEYKHREGELQRYGGPFPDHCMDKTLGQLKIDETTLRLSKGPQDFSENYHDYEHYVEHALDAQFVPNQIHEAMRIAGLGNFGVYFEKQNYNVFTNPSTELVLEKLGVEEAVVYGVATDYCVKAAVLGMQERGIQTYVVRDAIKGITPEGEASALEEMVAAGAKLVTTDEVLQGHLTEVGE